ncbi:MAG: universal stress protein [Arthrobacter sp.]|jgi:nucleotide-binding universal stress UspA family protein|nr:universal stress protein [Arthrobacter sp.]
MSIVVAVAPGHDPGPSAQVGALLARSYRLPLYLVAVNAEQFGEDEAAAGGWAQDVTQALAMADASMPRGTVARVLVRSGASVRQVLLDVCREVEAERLVIGSSDRARPGRIELGSVAMSLLHSSPLPVVLVPREASAGGVERVARVTAAYDGSSTSGHLLLGARQVAQDSGAAFRVVSFGVTHPPGSVAGVSTRMQRDIMGEWAKDMVGRVRELAPDAAPSFETGIGFSWEEALGAVDWLPGEVLMVGSSSFGPLARVSLGSQAGKIVKHSSVPVVLVPRKAQEAYGIQA